VFVGAQIPAHKEIDLLPARPYQYLIWEIEDVIRRFCMFVGGIKLTASFGVHVQLGIFTYDPVFQTSKSESESSFASYGSTSSTSWEVLWLRSFHLKDLFRKNYGSLFIYPVAKFGLVF
jgi:hypothetical protein